MAAPDWKGLFDWSMRYQDGTQAGVAKEMKPEDRAWFEEAFQHYTMDAVRRMSAIKEGLDKDSQEAGEDGLHQKEQLLDELMEIVENIDYASDLTKIGGMNTLLSLLESSYPSLRQRAAEVIGVSVQGNLPVQLWFLEAGTLPKLMQLLEDSDAVCRQKGLLAISCLIRNNALGLADLLKADGPTKLEGLLAKDVPRVQRKVLQLMTYIVQEKPQELSPAKILPSILHILSNPEDVGSDVREAALGLLVQFSRHSGSFQILKQSQEVESSLQQNLERIKALSKEQQEEAEDERSSVQQLLDILKKEPQQEAPAQNNEQQSTPTVDQKPVLLLGPPLS